MEEEMLIIDSVRYTRPDAYRARLIDEDGNLLITKQVPSTTAIRKDTGKKTPITEDNPYIVKPSAGKKTKD